MRVLAAVLFSVQVFAATAYDVRKHEGPDLDATITRFPMRIRLTATRRYEGGPPMQDVVVVEVHDVRDADADPRAFTRPADYRHQEPVIGVPGVG